MVTDHTLRDFNPELFADSYRRAAARWSACLETLNLFAEVTDFPHDKVGGDGETFSCSTAWLGPKSAVSVLVLISGTHGVEGFAGSAVQCDLLDRLAGGAVALPEDSALLCIHALNPWGCAHFRRCDDLGIDVNRNFIDFPRPPPENPGFLRVREALGVDGTDARNQALAALAADMGQRDYEIAFSGGQYSDPDAPFYGGAEASFSRRVIETLMTRHRLAERRLAVVDVHSGLGPYGYGEVICDHPSASGSARTAHQWYGPACALPDEGTSFSVPKLGLMDYAWHRIMGPDSCFVTLEFGTLGTASLFDTLLEEAFVWRNGQPADAQRLRAAANMYRHFCPDDGYWRETVIFRGRQVIHQALAGVSSR